MVVPQNFKLTRNRIDDNLSAYLRRLKRLWQKGMQKFQLVRIIMAIRCPCRDTNSIIGVGQNFRSISRPAHKT